MRLITWNCSDAFTKKAAKLFELNPDIAVVQECTAKDAKIAGEYGYSVLWLGDEPVKGMGIFAKHNWALTLLAQPEVKWIAGLQVSGPTNFTLIAVWSCPKDTGYKNYVKAVSDGLKKHPEWFDGDTVVAGDFNSSSRWDDKTGGGHSSLVANLNARGLVSSYHFHYGKDQDKEDMPTFHQYRHKDKPFHIDYVFIPKTWKIGNLEVGTHAHWSNHSDHCPIILDVSQQTEVPNSSLS